MMTFTDAVRKLAGEIEEEGGQMAVTLSNGFVVEGHPSMPAGQFCLTLQRWRDSRPCYINIDHIIRVGWKD